MNSSVSKPGPTAIIVVAAVAGLAFVGLMASRLTAPPSLNVEVLEESSADKARRTFAAAAAEEAKGTLPPDDASRRYFIPVTKTQPSKGPEDALVTIVNWCSFRSPVCRESRRMMNALLKKYDGDLRWVFRSLPDHPADLHVYVFAQAAHMQGDKFWKARELIESYPVGAAIAPNAIGQMAAELGMDWTELAGTSTRNAMFLEVDQRFAKQFGVTQPTFFVNGRRVLAEPAHTLEDRLTSVIEKEMAVARAQVQAGTSRAKVHREIVKDGYWGVEDDPAKRAAAAAAEGTAGEAADTVERAD